MQAGLGVTQALVKPDEITDAVGFMSLGMPSLPVSALPL